MIPADDDTLSGYDLVAEADHLVHVVDGVVRDHRALITRYRALAAAARAVVFAWSQGRLDRDQILALSAATTAPEVVDGA